MTIKEYLDRIPDMKSNDGITLRDTVMEITEIWSNTACMGFSVLAMQNAGFTRDQILSVLTAMEFEGMSTDQAEYCYTSFMHQ